MAKEGYTLLDIHHVVADERKDTTHPMSPQMVYNARSRVAQTAELWTPNERLTQPHPIRYTPAETQQLFVALRHPTLGYGTRDTGVVSENQLTTRIIERAEERLFDTIQPLPSDQPDAFVVFPKIETSPDDDAFPIRAHHLKIYSGLLKPGSHAYVAAMASVDGMRSIQEGAREYPERYTDDTTWYVQDVIGDTIDEKNTRYESLRATYEAFYALPDDHPVDLLAGQKDGICNGCIYGEHCTFRTFSLRPEGTLEHDQNFLSIFAHEAVRQGRAAEIAVTAQKISFVDDNEHVVEAIRTTAGTLKSVVINSGMNWKKLSDEAIKRSA